MGDKCTWMPDWSAITLAGTYRAQAGRGADDADSADGKSAIRSLRSLQEGLLSLRVMAPDLLSEYLTQLEDGILASVGQRIESDFLLTDNMNVVIAASGANAKPSFHWTRGTAAFHIPGKIELAPNRCLADALGSDEWQKLPLRIASSIAEHLCRLGYDTKISDEEPEVRKWLLVDDDAVQLDVSWKDKAFDKQFEAAFDPAQSDLLRSSHKDVSSSKSNGVDGLRTE